MRRPCCGKGESVAEKKNKRWRRYVLFTLLFCITAAVILFPFYSRGVSLVWMGDGNDEYYPALAYIGHYWREFAANLLGGGTVRQYDFAIGLGGDAAGTLFYYGFGSPLTLTAALVRAENTAYLYSFLTVLRWYLGGVAFLWYAARRGMGEVGAVAGALAYAFCPFALHYAMLFPAGFGDALYLLPLALAGVDDVLEGKVSRKRGFPLLVLAIGLQAFCGFYFLYMESLFLLIYFLIRFWALGRETASAEKKERAAFFFQKMFSCLGYYLLGLAMGAVILVPALWQFLRGSRTEQVGFSIGAFLQPMPLSYYKDAFLHFFSPDKLYSFGFPVLFLPVLLAFVGRGKASGVRRREIRGLLLAVLLMYFLPGTNYVMSAFAYYDTRWTFFLFFVMALAIAEAEELIRRFTLRQRIATAGLMLAWALGCAGYLHWSEGVGKRELLYRYGTLAALLLLALGMAALYDRYGKENVLVQRAAAGAILLVMTANLAFCGLQRMGMTPAGGQEWFWQYKTYAELREAYEQSAVNPAAYPEQKDGVFYRIDAWDSSKNAGLLYPANTTSAYFSNIDSVIGEFWRKLRISAGLRGTYNFSGTDGRRDIDALLSVHYAKDYNGGKLEGERFAVEDTLPLGVFYTDAVTETELEELPPQERAGVMLQAIVLPEEEAGGVATAERETYSVYPSETVPAEYEFENVLWNREQGYLEAEENAVIRVWLQWSETQRQAIEDANPYTGVVYVTMTDFVYDGTVARAYINGNEISTPQGGDGQDGYLVRAAVQDAGQPIEIKLPQQGRYRLEDIAVCLQDMSALPEQVRERTEAAQQSFQVGVNEVSGRSRTAQEGWLFFSIPYSPGWTAYVDGEKTRTVRADYSFTAVPVTAGEHEVRLSYRTPFSSVSAVLSVSVVLWLLYRGGRVLRHRRLNPAREHGMIFHKEQRR